MLIYYIHIAQVRLGTLRENKQGEGKKRREFYCVVYKHSRFSRCQEILSCPLLQSCNRVLRCFHMMKILL